MDVVWNHAALGKPDGEVVVATLQRSKDSTVSAVRFGPRKLHIFRESEIVSVYVFKRDITAATWLVGPEVSSEKFRASVLAVATEDGSLWSLNCADAVRDDCVDAEDLKENVEVHVRETSFSGHYPGVSTMCDAGNFCAAVASKLRPAALFRFCPRKRAATNGEVQDVDKSPVRIFQSLERRATTTLCCVKIESETNEESSRSDALSVVSVPLAALLFGYESSRRPPRRILVQGDVDGSSSWCEIEGQRSGILPASLPGAIRSLIFVASSAATPSRSLLLLGQYGTVKVVRATHIGGCELQQNTSARDVSISSVFADATIRLKDMEIEASKPTSEKMLSSFKRSFSVVRAVQACSRSSAFSDADIALLLSCRLSEKNEPRGSVALYKIRVDLSLCDARQSETPPLNKAETISSSFVSAAELIMSDVTRISMPVGSVQMSPTCVLSDDGRFLALFVSSIGRAKKRKRDTSDARNPNTAARSALGDRIGTALRAIERSTTTQELAETRIRVLQQQLAELCAATEIIVRGGGRNKEATMTSLGLCCVAGIGGNADLIRRRYLRFTMARPPVPSGHFCRWEAIVSLRSSVTNRVVSRSIPMRVYPIAPDAKKNSDSIVPWTFQVDIPPCFDASLFVRVQLSLSFADDDFDDAQSELGTVLRVDLGEFVTDILHFSRTISTYEDRARQKSAAFFAKNCSSSAPTSVAHVSKRLHALKSVSRSSDNPSSASAATLRDCRIDAKGRRATQDAVLLTSFFTVVAPRTFSKLSDALLWCVGRKSDTFLRSERQRQFAASLAQTDSTVNCVACESFERDALYVISVVSCESFNSTTPQRGEEFRSRIRLQLSASRPDIMPSLREAMLRRTEFVDGESQGYLHHEGFERSTQECRSLLVRADDLLQDITTLREKYESDRSFSPRLVASKVRDMYSAMVSAYSLLRGGSAQ